MITFRQFLENEEKRFTDQDLFTEEWQGKLRNLLNQIATASAAAGVVSLGKSVGVDLDQLDQMGIGINDIMDFLKRARLTVDQIKILTSMKEDMLSRLKDQCHDDLSKFRGTTNWLKEKGNSIDACAKYCKLTKDEKACKKSGNMVYNFGRYKRVVRNPFARS